MLKMWIGKDSFMRFFPLILLSFFILGCVHTELPFDNIKISFAEKKQTIVRENLPAPEVPVVEEKPIEKQPELEKIKPEEKKEIAVLPPVQENKVTIHEIQGIPDEVQGKMLLAKGNYTVEKKITVPKGSTLILSPGTILTFQECGIVCQGEIQAKGTASEPIVFQGADGWDNITILGEGAFGVFHHCEIKDGLGMEVQMQKDKQCLLEKGGTFQGGAVLIANKARGEMVDCTIQKNFSQSAIALIYAQAFSLKDCRILQNDENGVLSIETPCEISDSTFSENRKVGLFLEGVSKSTIKSSIFSQNRAGILVRENANPTIELNRIFGNVVGMEYQTTSSGILRENILERNQLCGILCIEESKPTLEKNKIEQNSIGILIKNNASPSIQQNTLRFNIEIALLMIDACSPTVQDNQITDSKIAMVLQVSTKANIQKNQIQNCLHEKQIAPQNAFDKK